MNQESLPSALLPVSVSWSQHPFYRSAVALGLDVGLEGIGVFVRRGPKILYAKTWVFNLPKAEPLKDRRQKRTARHCWANRRTRLRRLSELFAKHGLPDPERQPEVLARTNPFHVRLRAAEKNVASPMALAIAIRHCVAHRGYHYGYLSDEGQYPWGESEEFKDVKKGLAKLWLTDSAASDVLTAIGNFEHWKDSERAEIEALVESRRGGLAKLHERLRIHSKGDLDHVRPAARGEAFARSVIWEHLEMILRNNAHLVKEPDSLREALAVQPRDADSKARSIFGYHRKTPDEMRAHFEKKTARCAFASWLGLGSDIQCGESGELAIRKFKLLEFAATRRIELATGERVQLPEEWIQKLLLWIESNPKACRRSETSELKKQLEKDLRIAHGAKPAAAKKGSFNEAFYESFADLLAPSAANRRKNAGMSVRAAEKLYTHATAHGFTRDAVVAALNAPLAEDRSYYDFRRDPRSDPYGVYPQVAFLLGERVKKAKTKNHRRGDLAHPGRLQRLFADLQSKGLIENAAPDFAVVEVIRDAPRTLDERSEILAAQKKRYDERQELYAKHGVTDAGKTAERSRIKLHAQQGGVCPFTGASLGDNPLADTLEREHLYPQESGGLTIDENLVITHKTTNARKGKRTPRQFAQEVLGLPFEEMLAHTRPMRWSAAKRSIFAWEEPAEVPPFANTTRVAQLARQLHAEIASWMGVKSDEIRLRIGTPGGFQTSACRACWGFPKKDRERLTHHLEDAAILAHIPPGDGLNLATNGGIFFPRYLSTERRTVLAALPLAPDVAAIAALAASDAMECPVERHRPSSHKRSIHDGTLLRVLSDGSLAYRKELPDKATLDADALRTLLLDSGIPQTSRDRNGRERDLIPSRAALEKWLLADGDEPLRLTDGTPVRSIWVRGKKGGLADSPQGFHAAGFSADGKPRGLKAISASRWDALELWRGWDAKKNRWAYYKRLIPSREQLVGLRSLGVSWTKKSTKSWRPGGPVLDQPLVREVCGTLPPYAVRALHPLTKQPVRFRIGDIFRATIAADGKLTGREQRAADFAWVQITAVKGEKRGTLQIDHQIEKDSWQDRLSSCDDLAFLAGLPPADDSSSYPTQRAPRPARAGGKADLRLE